MLSVVERRGFERFEDLHIDRIDKRWKDRGRWIEGGLRALQLGIELRDQYRFEFTVALGFSLRVPESFQMRPPANMEDLAAQLDQSPPSLYLFPKRREPWLERAGSIATFGNRELDSVSLGHPPQWYYLEFIQDGRDYRSMFAAM